MENCEGTFYCQRNYDVTETKLKDLAEPGAQEQ